MSLTSPVAVAASAGSPRRVADQKDTLDLKRVDHTPQILDMIQRSV